MITNWKGYEVACLLVSKSACNRHICSGIKPSCLKSIWRRMKSDRPDKGSVLEKQRESALSVECWRRHYAAILQHLPRLGLSLGW